MCTPSRLPAPPAHFTQRRSSCKAEADHQAGWAGAWEAEGSEPEVLEWREEDLDIRRWRAWQPLEECGRRWRGWALEDGYGRRGKRKVRWGPWGDGVVDMGRRWGAWRRLGEQERWWRGLGVGVAYGLRGERETWWGSSEEGEVDMGRGWRAWWCLAERERRERGPGWSWWRLGERERRKWVFEARWRCGERERRRGCAVRGDSGSAAVCGTGLRRSGRASQEVSAGPGGPHMAPPGTWGGESPALPLIRHVGVRWRQRLG